MGSAASHAAAASAWTASWVFFFVLSLTLPTPAVTRGTIEERSGCSLNGKINWRERERPPPLSQPSPSSLPPPQYSSSAFDRTPVLSSTPLFFSFLLFSPRALYNPLSLSLSLPAKCSCCSPLAIFSPRLLIRTFFLTFVHQTCYPSDCPGLSPSTWRFVPASLRLW